MINEVNCPICGSSDLKKKLLVEDHFLSHEEFKLDECSKCGLILTNPKPEPEALFRYYQSEEYISHNASKSDLFSFIYRLIRNYSYRSKLKLIRKFGESGFALDIGCGTGEFLNHLNNKKYEVKGIEPNLSARNFAIKEYNLNVYDEEQLNKFDKRSFDLITMWHVLEHVNDINERIEVIKELLKLDGTLIIALPNPNSFDSINYQEFWAAWDVPRHLFHFTEKSLETLLNKFDLEIVNVKPMIFDAFYISLLSEKYKNKNSSYIKSFFSGLKSNQKAKDRKFGYSSQIYLVKHISA